MATDLEGCGISNSHVTKYVTELRSVGRLYEKVLYSEWYNHTHSHIIFSIIYCIYRLINNC